MIVAEKIVESLAEYCVRIEVAGSLRRGVPEVSDIEIVAIPHRQAQGMLFSQDVYGGTAPSLNLLNERLNYLLSTQVIAQSFDVHGRPAWGDKMRKFLVPTKQGNLFKVDLFMCTPENWGNIFLIRTGSRDFSRYMVTITSSFYAPGVPGALPQHMRHRDGRLWEWDYGDWAALEVPEEQNWFNLVELPFIPPQYRHDDKWFAFVNKAKQDDNGN